MTEDQALKETIELWEKIADYAEKGIAKDKREIDGPWQDYRYSCPCCEYNIEYNAAITGLASNNCDFCPMKRQWQYYYDTNYNIHTNIFCEVPESPYSQWRQITYFYKERTLFYDLEFFCRLIVELAEEARKELK